MREQSVMALAGRLEKAQEPTDSQLVQRIHDGDRLAFDALLERYEARVYRLASRFTRGEQDAEDLTQEIFLAVYKSLGRFRGASSLSTWIYRVAMNHCLEYRRKRRLDVVPYTDELSLAADWRDNPESTAGRAELSREVNRALQQLSPQHREVVILHELHGLTYQEVAAILDVPVGTVKSRLSNAFQRLRPLLATYVVGDMP